MRAMARKTEPGVNSVLKTCAGSRSRRMPALHFIGNHFAVAVMGGADSSSNSFRYSCHTGAQV
jgi:hypothetical protein